MTTALTVAAINDIVAYMREHQVLPHADGCYDVALRPGFEQQAFDLGLAPFCPLYDMGVTAVRAKMIVSDAPAGTFEGYWERRDYERGGSVPKAPKKRK